MYARLPLTTSCYYTCKTSVWELALELDPNICGVQNPSNDKHHTAVSSRISQLTLWGISWSWIPLNASWTLKGKQKKFEMAGGRISR